MRVTLIITLNYAHHRDEYAHVTKCCGWATAVTNMFCNISSLDVAFWVVGFSEIWGFGHLQPGTLHTSTSPVAHGDRRIAEAAAETESVFGVKLSAFSGSLR